MIEENTSPDSEALRACVAVMPSITEATWHDGSVHGEIILDSASWNVLTQLEEHAVVRFRASGHTRTLQQLRQQYRTSDKVEVVLSPPRTPSAFFANDVDDLISSHDFHERVPPYVFVRSISYLFDRASSTHDGMPEVFAHYLGALEMAHFVVRVADHKEKRIGRLWVILLIKGGKLELPVTYREDDLRHLSGLTSLKKKVLAAPHEDEKMILFKSAVWEVLGQVVDTQRFATLLGKYEVVKEKFEANYELYVSKFSFEDDREKLEEKRREYLLKLNAALADIHTKLIAIPAAVVLVGGQMKEVTSSAVLLANTVLLSGAFVFAVLMLMITRNQDHSLAAVKREYTRRRQRFQLELPNLYCQIKEAFDDLDERYLHQRRLLVLINYLVGIGLFFSCWIFVYFYPVLSKHLASVLQALVER